MAPKYAGIQALRGMAALLVLLVHVKLLFIVPADSFFSSFLMSGGAVGVDLFFVISGFVVAMAAQRAPSASKFLWNRVTRVMPLYLIASVASLAIVSKTTSTQILNTFTLAPLFDRGVWVPPLHQFGWSVALEMWFYVLLAAALFFFRKRVVVAFAVAVVSLVLAGLAYSGDSMLLRFFSFPLALEFLFGVGIYAVRERFTRAGSWAAIVVGIALGWVAINACPSVAPPGLIFIDPPMGLLRAITWGLPCAFLVAGVVWLDQDGRLKWPAPMAKFGDISYSFYLVQPFAFFMLSGLAFSSWWVAAAAALVLNTVLSAASYRWLERPITRALRTGPMLLSAKDAALRKLASAHSK